MKGIIAMGVRGCVTSEMALAGGMHFEAFAFRKPMKSTEYFPAILSASKNSVY